MFFGVVLLGLARSPNYRSDEKKGTFMIKRTPPSFKVGGEIGAEPNLLLIQIWLYIRNIRGFLNKGAIYPNLLFVYLL